jgi:hypothetical protein
MHILDLTFSDGRACRCIVMEPTNDAEDQAGIRSIFKAGYLSSIERRIPPCPEKLPWEKDRGHGDPVWRLHRFTLRKDAGAWLVEWPGGSARGNKDEVSAALRNNWAAGC